MNITKLTENYIQQHPHIKACLKKGMVNYSSLTRAIAEEMNLNLKKNFDAILIACRRYKTKISKRNNDKEILGLLKNSKIEVKNKVISIALERDVPPSNLALIEKKIKSRSDQFHMVASASAITIITAEEYEKEINITFRNKVIKTAKNLVEITLKTSKEIENTTGVLSFLYSLFAEAGINIIDTMSCWTDTIFIIEEKSLPKVMEILRF